MSDLIWKSVLALVLVVHAPLVVRFQGADHDKARVGEGGNGTIVVPTNQVLSPVGRQVGVSGRPVDCVLSPDGRWLGGMESSRVAIIVPGAGKVASRVAHAGGGSFTGIAFSPDSKRLYAAT